MAIDTVSNLRCGLMRKLAKRCGALEQLHSVFVIDFLGLQASSLHCLRHYAWLEYTIHFRFMMLDFRYSPVRSNARCYNTKVNASVACHQLAAIDWAQLLRGAAANICVVLQLSVHRAVRHKLLRLPIFAFQGQHSQL